MKRALVTGLLIALLPTLAAAEALPEYVLDKDYQNCMGNDPSDNDRAAYCACVREGMRRWDTAAYQSIAGQVSANANQVPPQLATLAKECIAKVLH